MVPGVHAGCLEVAPGDSHTHHGSMTRMPESHGLAKSRHRCPVDLRLDPHWVWELSAEWPRPFLQREAPVNLTLTIPSLLSISETQQQLCIWNFPIRRTQKPWPSGGTQYLGPQERGYGDGKGEEELLKLLPNISHTFVTQRSFDA